jgi:hypothetical protein
MGVLDKKKNPITWPAIMLNFNVCFLSLFVSLFFTSHRIIYHTFSSIEYLLKMYISCLRCYILIHIMLLLRDCFLSLLFTQDVSKRDLQECYCMASVTKTFTRLRC